jgi:hypothetical protein
MFSKNNVQQKFQIINKNKNLLELVSVYGKVMGYRFIYKSQLLSYMPAMNNWHLELKIQHSLY